MGNAAAPVAGAVGSTQPAASFRSGRSRRRSRSLYAATVDDLGMLTVLAYVRAYADAFRI
jgi:hypothetical protein